MKTITTLKKLSKRIAPVFLMVVTATVLLAPTVVFASTTGEIQEGVNAVGGSGGDDFEDILKNVINILLFLVGATAVIMLIVGGFRYVTSNGDSSAITSAKNTILYSIIGIVVALAAYAIVNFVIDQFQ